MEDKVDENSNEAPAKALAEVPLAKVNANANVQSAAPVLSRYDALQDVVQLRADLSNLHKALAEANESIAEMHSKLEAVNEEKVAALKELEDELTRGLDHSSQRTDAEVKLRKMEADIKALSNSNDTIRLFQEYDAARKKQDDLIATLRAELASTKSDAKRAAAVANASKKDVQGVTTASENEASEGKSSLDGNGAAAATTPGASNVDGEKVDGSTEALSTPGGASITTSSSSGKSPREIVLESAVGSLKNEMLEISDTLLYEREETTSRLEECLEVVEDAELTANAAREVGEEATRAAEELQRAADEAWLKSEADAEAAAKVAAELGALELKLLDVELENEALRAQLVTSGIEPQVQWWKDELAGLHGLSPVAAKALASGSPRSASSQAPPEASSPYYQNGSSDESHHFSSQQDHHGFNSATKQQAPHSRSSYLEGPNFSSSSSSGSGEGRSNGSASSSIGSAGGSGRRGSISSSSSSSSVHSSMSSALRSPLSYVSPGGLQPRTVRFENIPNSDTTTTTGPTAAAASSSFVSTRPSTRATTKAAAGSAARVLSPAQRAALGDALEQWHSNAEMH